MAVKEDLTIVIIALPPGHPVAQQLAQLAREVRESIRGDAPPDTMCLRRAMNLTEASRGSRAATYKILPGSASSEDAIAAYQHIRRHHQGVLTLLSMAASENALEITVEVGTLARRDEVIHSNHDLMTIMPRILAFFRGTFGAR